MTSKYSLSSTLAHCVAALLITTLADAAPEIRIRGNGTTIADGDSTPSTTDHTFFGVVTLGEGQALTRSFTITNTSDLNFDFIFLTGTPRVSVGGANADDFTVTQVPREVLYGGQSSTFEVTFFPTGGGIRNATLSIPNNDSNEDPYDFAIQATVKLALNSSAGPSSQGTLSGNASQSVDLTGNSSAVTVVANPGSVFFRWNDGSRANPRTDTNSTENLAVSALYYSYTSDGSEVTISDCDTAVAAVLVLPATIDGLPVTGIRFSAFSSCDRLTDVTIPENITEIGAAAFMGCTKLASITVPQGVATIGHSAFRDCATLTGVAIPDSVTTIGYAAFFACGALKKSTFLLE